VGVRITTCDPCGGVGPALLERFSNCYTPEPLPLSGFFLKKKSPCTALARAHLLENRSSGVGLVVPPSVSLEQVPNDEVSS